MKNSYNIPNPIVPIIIVSILGGVFLALAIPLVVKQFSHKKEAPAAEVMQAPLEGLISIAELKQFGMDCYKNGYTQSYYNSSINPDFTLDNYQIQLGVDTAKFSQYLNLTFQTFKNIQTFRLDTYPEHSHSE
jgi:hypothetical protein